MSDPRRFAVLILILAPVGWLLNALELVRETTILIAFAGVTGFALLRDVDAHRARTLAALERIATAIDDLKRQS